MSGVQVSGPWLLGAVEASGPLLSLQRAVYQMLVSAGLQNSAHHACVQVIKQGDKGRVNCVGPFIPGEQKIFWKLPSVFQSQLTGQKWVHSFPLKAKVWEPINPQSSPQCEAEHRGSKYWKTHQACLKEVGS